MISFCVYILEAKVGAATTPKAAAPAKVAVQKKQESSSEESSSDSEDEEPPKVWIRIFPQFKFKLSVVHSIKVTLCLLMLWQAAVKPAPVKPAPGGTAAAAESSSEDSSSEDEAPPSKKLKAGSLLVLNLI